MWLSGQCVRLTILQSRVQVLFLALAGFVLAHPEFKPFATLVMLYLNNNIIWFEIF